ncbi:hypothetical protein ID866_2501, partial [Astraeus odoratus]
YEAGVARVSKFSEDIVKADTVRGYRGERNQ